MNDNHSTAPVDTPGETAADSGNNSQSIRGSSLATRESTAEPSSLLGRVLFYPYAVLFLAILIFFDLLQRLALVIGPRWQERAAHGLNLALLHSLKFLGIRAEMSGQSNLPHDQPLIIVSNHQSMFDLCLIYVTFAAHRPRYIAKIELSRRVPAISICLRSDGSALIDRREPQQAIPEIKRLGSKMEAENFAVILFPEGTRAKTGALKKFRSGGFNALLETSPSANVIPVAVDQTWKITQNKLGPIPLGIKLKLKIGQPLDRNQLTPKQLLRESYLQIESMLNDIRSA